MKKRRPITLLEIMIVILLIGLIAGVVGYNLKGTLERGKAFKSEQGAAKLADILNLEIQQERARITDLVNDNKERLYIQQCLRNSGLIAEKEIKKFIVDGWNDFFEIERDHEGGGIKATSANLEKYKKAHGG
jgi:general secretion pathway protein G